MNWRTKHHKTPRYAVRTKCAASTKKTPRVPFCASASRGSSAFFKSLLRLDIRFRRNRPGFAQLHADPLQKFPCAFMAPFEPGQLFNRRHGFLDGGRRMGPEIFLQCLPVIVQLTARSVELHGLSWTPKMRQVAKV